MKANPAWRSAAKLFTKDEARRIAANIAKSPKPAATHNPQPEFDPATALRIEFANALIT